MITITMPRNRSIESIRRRDGSVGFGEESTAVKEFRIDGVRGLLP